MEIKDILKKLAKDLSVIVVSDKDSSYLVSKFRGGFCDNCAFINKYNRNGYKESYIFPKNLVISYDNDYNEDPKKLHSLKITIKKISPLDSDFNRDEYKAFDRFVTDVLIYNNPIITCTKISHINYATSEEWYKIQELNNKGIGLLQPGTPVKFFSEKNIFDIKKVIFNPPATIVIFNDGTKTVVKCHDETFDQEKGLLMCIIKNQLGNKSNFNNVINKYIENAELTTKVQRTTFTKDPINGTPTRKPIKKRGKKK